MDLCPLQNISQLKKTGRRRNPGECWVYLHVSDHNRWPSQDGLSEKKMILFELFQWIHPTRDDDTDMYVKSFWSRLFFLRWITADPSPWGNFTPPMIKDLVWRDPGGPWARFRPFSDYKWIHPSRDCSWHRHTIMWRLCEAGRFSYGEPPRTPPLEGTSLHRRNNSVERPWGTWACLRPVYD